MELHFERKLLAENVNYFYSILNMSTTEEKNQLKLKIAKVFCNGFKLISALFNEVKTAHTFKGIYA